jgi:hypothetical protein
MKDLVKRVRALDRFLVAYRTGGQPSEKAFSDIRETANAVNEAENLTRPSQPSSREQGKP